jgi:hypothetical protein
VATWEADLRAQVRDFGIDVLWTDAGGTHPVRVIFDNEYLAAQLHGGEVSVSSPEAFGVASDLRGVAVGQTLTIPVDEAEVAFKITELQPDGQGGLTMRLCKDTV